MFVSFFYDLRESGIAVTPTAFLRLQKALGLGLISSWDDFYSVARAVLVGMRQAVREMLKAMAEYSISDL